jgi:hypothetical protein
MMLGLCIDDLLEAGWRILYNGFEFPAFESWRQQALDCLNSLLGADHPYAQSFSKYVEPPEEMSLLIGAGILAAAKEEIEKQEDRGNPF